jgi:hypothetical protein
MAADAAVAVEVPAGAHKSIRLRDVPAGTAMAVAIQSSGKLVVALVSEKQIRTPQLRASPLFRGVLERRLAFRVTIPERGNYFLVLSNRGGVEPLEVQAEIRTVGAPRKPAPAPGERDKMPST